MTGSRADNAVEILTYCPMPYNGKGPAQSCVSLLTGIAESGMRAKLVLPRITPYTSSRFPPGALDGVSVKQILPPVMRAIPWRYISGFSRKRLDRMYCRFLENSNPASTIAYFWPDASIQVIERARALGFITVREMINCYRGTAKRILDAAHASLGLPATHGISSESVDIERRELKLYDYVFASNACAEESLREAGVENAKILPASFGWLSSKYHFDLSKRGRGPIVVLFVGTVCLRKGIPFLLRAWKRLNVAGKLVIAGAIDKELMPFITPYFQDPSITFMQHVSDPSSLYSAAHIFVFPTLEEGGPQVVYEAAGAGLPVITTPMGMGRIVKNQENGLVVDACDVDGLVEAITVLSESTELRERFGARGKLDANHFEYRRIGAERGIAMSKLLVS